jgi:hypothetical protein
MYKYLVKVIFEEVTETIDGEDYTRETNVVDSYKVKYRTDARAKPRGGGHIFLESEEKLKSPIVLTDEFGGLSLAEDPAELLSAQVTVKYSELVKDVYAEMKRVFGTTNDISASATASTYEAMSKRPAKYVDPTIGLNNASAVKVYADAKLDDMDAYGIFRLKRLAQYQAEKTAILTP